MNRRFQYAKMVTYLASKGLSRELPKHYAAGLNPNEDYDFEDMTSVELEAYASVLSQVVENPHDAMDMAMMYREMAFISDMLKGSSTDAV